MPSPIFLNARAGDSEQDWLSFSAVDDTHSVWGGIAGGKEPVAVSWRLMRSGGLSWTAGGGTQAKGRRTPHQVPQTRWIQE